MRSLALTIPVLLCLASAPLQAQDQRAKAQALVKEAVAFAKKSGKEALIKETNMGQGRFHVKSGEELYIFIYDPEGTCLAIGFQTNLVGVNRINAKDPGGKFFIKEIVETAKSKGSGWVDYKYPNPKTSTVQDKTSYVEFLDGLIIGCGVYK